MIGLARGTVLLIDLAPVVGHEQHGVRPCVVVSDEALVPHQRFPVITIIPVTSTVLTGPLYPALVPSRTNGFTRPSVVLVDHLRALDRRRVRARLGTLAADDLSRVDDALRLFLGL